MGAALTYVSSVLPDLDVIEFLDSMEALDYLQTHRVALIITDLRMPCVNGLGLISAVRAVDDSVPIIMTSGEDMEQVALDRGANAFIHKLSFGTELVPAIERLGIHVPA
jgi:CheY-like chemotaxis protein